MGFFNFRKEKNKEYDFLNVFLGNQASDLQVKELLIEHAIDLIAKTISKSEIQVFRNVKRKVIKEVDDVYYKLNVRPNANEDGTTFIYNIVAKLIRENEALVVRMENDDLFLADRFEKSEHIISGKSYSEIVLSDNDGNEIELNKVVHADDALYMSLGNNEIKRVLDQFYTEYAELIKASSSGFKRSNYGKYVLEIPSTVQMIKNPSNQKEINMDEYVKTITGDLLKDEDSVVGLSERFKLQELNKQKILDSKDVRELYKDFGDKVAMAFNIPLDVYWGNKTEKSVGTNDFLTFAVLPFLKIINDSFNAKLIEKQSFLNGERIKFDTFTMKHFDIMDIASSMDKLFAIGWSHNDLNEIIGVPLKEEEWANKHHVTKNYSDVNEIDKEGGE